MKKDNLEKLVEEELDKAGILETSKKRKEKDKKIIDSNNNLKSTAKNKIIIDIILILVGIVWLILMLI